MDEGLDILERQPALSPSGGGCGFVVTTLVRMVGPFWEHAVREGL